MTGTLTYTGTLTIVACWCGIEHAIPADLYRHAKASRDNAVHCPLGHKWVVRKSAADEEREKRQAAEQRAVRLQAEVDRAEAAAEHQRNVANGYKGALAKSKKRAAKGVCPVPGCKRHFVDVERHIASKHPDYAGGET